MYCSTQDCADTVCQLQSLCSPQQWPICGCLEKKQHTTVLTHLSVCVCVCWVTSLPHTALPQSVFHLASMTPAPHPCGCASVLTYRVKGKYKIPEGKFEQTHLQDVQIKHRSEEFGKSLRKWWQWFFFISCLLLVQPGHYFLFQDISTLHICWECKHNPGFSYCFLRRETSAF